MSGRLVTSPLGWFGRTGASARCLLYCPTRSGGRLAGFMVRKWTARSSVMTRSQGSSGPGAGLLSGLDQPELSVPAWEYIRLLPDTAGLADPHTGMHTALGLPQDSHG